MIKRASLLMGIAILAVVAVHAATISQAGEIQWVSVKHVAAGISPTAALEARILLDIRQLFLFAVPAFLAVAGFFVAWAARGTRQDKGWQLIRTRFVALVVPYLIWSFLILAGEAWKGHVYSLGEYARKLLAGDVEVAYYYVPLLLQFYLLSPWLLIPLARSRPRALIVGSAVVQIGAVAVTYLGTHYLPVRGAGGLFPALSSPALCIQWVLYFSLGLVCGFWSDRVKAWLLPRRNGLLVVVALLAVLVVGLFNAEGQQTSAVPGAEAAGVLVANTIVGTLYCVGFILCFLGFAEFSPQFAKTTYRLGGKSYGIYLLHTKMMGFVGGLAAVIFPGLLSDQLVFTVLLAVAGLAVPVLLMEGVAHSPARPAYRYLFG